MAHSTVPRRRPFFLGGHVPREKKEPGIKCLHIRIGAVISYEVLGFNITPHNGCNSSSMLLCIQNMIVCIRSALSYMLA